MLLSFCRLCSCSGMRCRILFGSVSCSEPGAILLLFSLLKNALTNGICTPSRRVGRPLDIALVSYPVSYAHIMFHVPLILRCPLQGRGYSGPGPRPGLTPAARLARTDRGYAPVQCPYRLDRRLCLRRCSRATTTSISRSVPSTASDRQN